MFDILSLIAVVCLVLVFIVVVCVVLILIGSALGLIDLGL